MKAIMSNAKYTAYNATTQSGGTVRINLSTSTNTGYPNNCSQYNPYGFISVPLPVQTVNTEVQALSEVIVTGYENTITDANFTLAEGESALYGTNWYFVNSVNGIYMQQVGVSPTTQSVENAMMGQSTNAVLKDILNRLIAIESWADSHTHKAGLYVAPSGGGSVTGTSGSPVTSSPSGDNINSDLTYITDNNNLAKTGSYNPHE